MLPGPVEHEVALACQNFATQVTGIAESVWEMLRLHVVSDVSCGFVGKSLTQCAIVLVGLIICLYALVELCWVLQCVA